MRILDFRFGILDSSHRGTVGWRNVVGLVFVEVLSPARAQFISVGQGALPRRPTYGGRSLKPCKGDIQKGIMRLMSPLQGFSFTPANVGRCPTLVNCALSGLRISAWEVA